MDFEQFNQKINEPFENRSRNGGGRKFRGFKKAPLIVLLLVLVFFFSSTGFYRVDEQETAVVTMFGKVVTTNTAGLYFRIPFLQKVHKVDTTIHGTGIGYAVNGDGQTFTVDTEGVMITSDFNLIDIDFYMEYKVSDPVAYLYHSQFPELILKNIALAAIRSTVIDYTVDEAMTTGKAQIQSQVRSKIQSTLTEQEIGLQIVNITVQDAEPPTTDIVKAFKAVETAKQGKDTAVNNATMYQNEKIPAAEAEVDRIIQAAEAQKASRIAEAEGQVARFKAMYEEYQTSKLTTKQRLYYEALETVLPKLKVIITDGGTETLYPLDAFSQTTVTGKSAE